MVSAKPSSLLSGISLVGFRGSRSSGRQERIGTAKVGYTITVNTGTGPTNVLLGVATVPFSGIGAFFVNAGETVKATGLPGSPPATYGDVAGTILTTFYSATITDTNGTATFTASATLPGDGNGGSTVANTTIIGNGTSKLTIETGSLTNLDTVLLQTLSATVSTPGTNDVNISVTDPLGNTGSGTLVLDAVCFTSGTRIATVSGAVAIEDLAVGDRVITARGEIHPIRWIGHRTISCGGPSHPSHPLRVRAGAFGKGLPMRDLLLSAGHHVFADGTLVPISSLENGVTIAREAVSQVTYWHVELDHHDVILAEGLPAESYLDTGNRAFFSNFEAATSLHPAGLDGDVEAQAWATRACAARAESGPQVNHLRWRLLERAKDLGVRTTADAGVKLSIDGQPVAAQWANGTVEIALPPDAQRLRIQSHSALPMWGHAENDDNRRLGVGIVQLVADGRTIAHDSAVLVSGFHGVERDGDRTWRWTDGDALLDVSGVRSLSIHIHTMNLVYPVSESMIGETARGLTQAA